MKFSRLIQNITRLFKSVKTFLEMSTGKLKSLAGTIYSTTEKAILSTLINCLGRWESLEETLAVNLVSLILCFTRFIITLLKIFEKLTTLSTKTRTTALVWWRLRRTIRLIRFLGSRRNTLRSLKVNLRTKLKPK